MIVQRHAEADDLTTSVLKLLAALERNGAAGTQQALCTKGLRLRIQNAFSVIKKRESRNAGHRCSRKSLGFEFDENNVITVLWRPKPRGRSMRAALRLGI